MRISGWWFEPPLKNMKVRDDYFQYMESPKIPWFQTTNLHHHDFDASYKLEQACCRSGSSKC
jgi:hypothetical protein